MHRRTVISIISVGLTLLGCQLPGLTASVDRNLDAKIHALIAKLGPGAQRNSCNPWSWGTGTEADHAAARLAIIGEPVVEHVLPLLTDPVEWRRVFAIDILMRVRDPRAIEPLIRVLREDVAAWVRAHAAYALGELQVTRAKEALFESLTDPDEHVRCASIRVLGDLHVGAAIPRFIQYLGTGGIKYRSFDCEPLSASKALISIGAPAIPVLLKSLTSHNAELRANATQLLGKAKVREAVPELTKLLHDLENELRESAAEALGEIGDPAAYMDLQKAVHSREHGVASRAIIALGQIGDRRAFPLVLKLLASQDESIQRSAVRAIGHFNDPRAIPALSQLLKGKDSGNKDDVVKAIGMIDDPRSTTLLMNAVDVNGGNTRFYIFQALAERADPMALPLFFRSLKDKDSNVSTSAAVGIGRIDFARLVSLLTDRDWEIRSIAAIGLRKLNDPRAISALIRALDTKAPRFIIRALGALGDVSVIPRLMPFLDSKEPYMEEAAISAIDALQKIERTKSMFPH